MRRRQRGNDTRGQRKRLHEAEHREPAERDDCQPDATKTARPRTARRRHRHERNGRPETEDEKTGRRDAAVRHRRPQQPNDEQRCHPRAVQR